MFVSYDVVLSDSINVTTVFPQGFRKVLGPPLFRKVLGPLIFSMFINDLLDSLHSIVYSQTMFSCFPHDTVPPHVNRMNDDLSEVLRWSMDDGLLLHPAKSKAILSSVDQRYISESIPLVHLGTESVKYSNSSINLGLTLVRRLSYRKHVSIVIAKIF